MWIPKTEEELNIEEKKKEKDALRSGLFFFIFFPLIVTFSQKFIGTQKGVLFDFTLSWSQILENLPRLFIISAICGIVVYIGFRKFNTVSTLVCLKCGKLIKYKKNIKCDCGGELRMLNEMKWSEDNDQNQSTSGQST